MDVRFPATIADAIGADRYRAGGVDVQSLLGLMPLPEVLTDLTRTDGMVGVDTTADGRTRIGAATPLATLVSRLAGRHPALAATAAEVATPQIRNIATVAGDLAQATRCWYFRNPLVSCFKSGGDGCPARDGDNLYGVADDLGPCAFPHPSSLGAALLAHDATLEIDATRELSLADFFGDGSDPRRDHRLGRGELITAVLVPAPWPGERGGYERAISRSHAEWPLVESVCRISIDDGVVADIAIGVGGVANIPLRLRGVEDAVRGRPIDTGVVADAVRDEVATWATPAQTAYKTSLTVTVVGDAVDKAVG